MAYTKSRNCSSKSTGHGPQLLVRIKSASKNDDGSEKINPRPFLNVRVQLQVHKYIWAPDEREGI